MAVPKPTEQHTAPAPGTGGAAVDAGALTTGTVVAGLGAYVFVMVGTRDLGAAAFAPVSVLWTWWSMAAAVITFPVQHWVIRTLNIRAGEASVHRAAPALFGAGLLVSMVTVVAAYLARVPLYGHGGLLFPALTGLIPLGSLLVAVNRGALAGRERFAATGIAIGGENIIRVAVVLLAAAVWTTTPTVYGWAIIAGFGIAVLWPSSFRFSAGTSSLSRSSAMASLSGVAGGSLLSQIVLTSGPVVLALLGGRGREVTSLFAALALFRAPYLVMTGLSARITGTITRHATSGNRETLQRWRRFTLVVGAGLTAVAALAAPVFGPPILRFLFGSDVYLSSNVLAVLAGASILALLNLLAMVDLIARDRGQTITLSWLTATGVGAVLVVGGPDDPLARVSLAFLVAELVALVAMMRAGSVPVFKGPANRPGGPSSRGSGTSRPFRTQ